MNAHEPTDHCAEQSFMLIFVLLAIGIVAIGYIYYRNYERNYRAEDEERRRIARALHDSTGQKLAALSMTIGLLQDATGAPAGPTDKMFADCLATIEQWAQEIRTHSYLLHPPLLDELGLSAAIGFLVKTYAKRQLAAAVDALAQHRPFFTGAVAAFVLDAFLHPDKHPAKTGAPAGRLTPREREVVQLIAEGKTSKDIARLLGLSVKTADAHRANIMRKLDLHSVSELVLYAVRNQIVQA